MKRLFGYIRVSTTKQAEKGVSLNEQRDAISAYASKHGFQIVEWFEEWQTAAKRGRPKFSAMLAALRKGKADGVVIHKIDRSARNLRDWSDLGEMVDAGIDVHLAHEPLDLRSRGGRLSADILAVVAADFIRNNRDEARKGFYGRLKEGIYPLGAPIGYVDNGKGGKVKTVDPERAPLVRYAFERYATGEVSLAVLAEELEDKGLRNRAGKPLPVNRLAAVLRNPFYAGIIRLKKTGETFTAVHEPLVRASVFERVQEVLDGKKPRRRQVHDFLYRRLVACATCGRSLVASRVKGKVYYRCQVTKCPSTCLREDLIDRAVEDALRGIGLPDATLEELRAEIERSSSHASQTATAERARLTGELGALGSRLERLTDVYIDGRLDKADFEERRLALTIERQKIADRLASVDVNQPARIHLAEKCLQLARSPEKLYRAATPHEKRRLLGILTSNRTASGKNVVITASEPFCFFRTAQSVTSSALGRGTPPTFPLAERLWKWSRTVNDRLDELERLLVAITDELDYVA